MLVAVVLRAGTRAKITHTLGLDDVLCIIAAVFTVAYAAVTLPFLGNPLGRHQWDVPLSDVTNRFVASSLEAQVFNNLAIMFIKISLMEFYLRIFKPVRWAKSSIWAGLAAVSIFYIVTTIVLLVVCVPRNGNTWLETSAKLEYTIQSKRITLATGWFGIFADIYIIAIPISLVSTLTLSKGRKIGIIAIFLTGLM
ncbi:hypothetical protein VMCG_03188 [Cytospora schulzeri]|uniref:Rhodopsin domain-containing protein n=1 Tax=Cytospora schulzeri TaxID=448051 RepID=A0A423WYA1_9PEZI|nr:hypothetical protein VMCG_03188 [Valsa malicola]